MVNFVMYLLNQNHLLRHAFVGTVVTGSSFIEHSRSRPELVENNLQPCEGVLTGKNGAGDEPCPAPYYSIILRCGWRVLPVEQVGGIIFLCVIFCW